MANNKEIKGLTVNIDGEPSGLKNAINEAIALSKKYERSLKLINKSLTLDPTNLDLYAKKQEILKKSIDETAEALKKLEDDKRQLDSQDVNTASDRYQELILKIEELKSKLKEYNSELTNSSPAMQAYIKSLDSMGDKLDTISSKTQGISRAFQLLSVAIANEAVDYESAVASVKKVIKDLSDESVDELKKIAVETGNTFDSVTEYATIGGTLGIAQDEIVDFTKTMLDLNVATDNSIIGEDGAKKVARFLNVMGIGIDKAENFGSALTYVSDQFATTSDEVLDVASQLAGLKAITDVSENDLIGLSAVMKNLAVKTSSGATAITRTFTAISNAVAEGGDKLETFARTSGMSADEFKKAWSKNTMNTFIDFIDGLKSTEINNINEAVEKGTDSVMKYANALGYSKEAFIKAWSSDSSSTFEAYINSLGELDDEAETAVSILKDVGLTSVRTEETLFKLAGNGSVITEAIKDSSNAWRENTALTKKAGVMYDTTKYKLQGMWESLKQAGASIGESFLPVAKDIIDKITDIADWFEHTSETNRRLAASFIILAASVSPVTKAMSVSTESIASILTIANKTNKGIKSLIKNFEILSDESGTFLSIGSNMIFSLKGLATTLGLVGAAASYIYIQTKLDNDESYQTWKNINKLRQSYDDLNKTAEENYSKQMLQIESASVYIGTITDMVDKLKDKNLTEDESSAIKEKLATNIEKLNEALGGEYIYFDETNGLIDTQGNKIDDLSKKYDELAEKTRTSAWLSANADAYAEASQTLIDVAYEQEQALDDLESKLSKYSSEKVRYVKELYDEVARGVENSGSKVSNILANNDEYRNIYEAISMFAEETEKIESAKQKAVDVIDQYTKVQSEGIGALEESIGTTLSAVGMSVDELKAKIEETKEQRDRLLTLDPSGENESIQKRIDKQNEYLDILQTQLKKQQIAQTIINEQQGIIDSNAQEINNKLVAAQQKVAELGESILGETSTKSESAAIEFYDNLTSAMKNVAKYWNDDIYFSNKEVTITQKVRTVYVDANGYVAGGSGGFGDKLRSMSESIGKTLTASTKLHSGGYTTVSPNVVINVTNGNNITSQTVNGWAYQMIDVINEELGKRL